MSKPIPSCRHLQELLHYSQQTGLVTWNERPASMFPSQRAANAWNARFAGQSAGYIRQDGYLSLSLGTGNLYMVHRLIWKMMTGREPEYIDHLNGNRADNRWSNLREVDVSTNGKNAKLYSRNTSGHAGVEYLDKLGKWRARVQVGKKTVHLGLFSTKEKAVAARKEAERKNGYHDNHGRQQ